MGRPRVGVATCAEIVGLDPDGQAVVEALRAVGLDAAPVVWDDPHVDWAAYDLVLVRSTWDYAERHEAFLAWAEHVTAVARLCNRLEVLRWNTDKRYLADLDADGVPVVPTTFLEPGAGGDAVRLPAGVDHVVKPAISAGSRDTARYGPDAEGAARAHVERLLAAGRTVMVQPYLDRVDADGETGLVYLDGAFSHAFRKGPLLERGAGVIEGLFAPEDITARAPSPAERAVGDAAVDAAARRCGPLAYARVDLIGGPGGEPLVLELELTEPSLFLAETGASAAPLAAAVRRLAAGSHPGPSRVG